MAEGFRQLEVWRRALELAIACYRLSEDFPASERFGLSSQLRRAATSIASNIAEGRGRFSTREFIRHVSIARGSLCEVETQLEIARRLGFVATERVEPIIAECDELGRMLHALKSRLEKNLDAAKAPEQAPSRLPLRAPR